MKLYASENENLQLKQNKQCELVLVESKPIIKLTQKELHTPIDSHRLNVYSLEQHDRELLEEFSNNLMNVLSDEMFFEKEMEDIEIYVSQLLKERGAKINKKQLYKDSRRNV